MNLRAWRCACLFVPFLAGSGAAAESLAESPIILRSGSWDVHRSQDPMSDATVCTGVYNGRFEIQLGENSLTIAMPDRIRDVRLRFDEDRAQPARAATRSEIHNNRIEIDASDFATALNAHRLRYAATTFGGPSIDGDIDLSGIYVAHGNIRAGCAGNPIVMSMPPAPAPDKCTPELRQRMADNGIPAANIDQICRD